MEAVLTVRLDKAVKERGASVMARCGHTPSSAVRLLFDYAAKHDALPFASADNPSKEEIRARIAAFDACHTAEPLTMSDEEYAAKKGTFDSGIPA